MGDNIRYQLRTVATDELSAAEIAAIRAIMAEAFGDGDERFTDDDWQHASGGRHFVLSVAGRIVSHASVVERVLRVAGQPLRTGYVEAVATAPAEQGKGLATRVMAAVGEHVTERFELGVLGTGRQAFYERLGWRTWRGPSGVRTDGPVQPTPADDGYIMVLATRSSPELDFDAQIDCDWRPGDVW